jgi:uncharacterized membrane protein
VAIKHAGEMLKPGYSALFLTGQAGDPDKPLGEPKQFESLVAMTSHCEEQENRLTKAVAEKERRWRRR